MSHITVGVLALQGAFSEHMQCLRAAAQLLENPPSAQWRFQEVRTAEQLAACDALILPGGESTTMSLVAARSNLLEPLRDFVKVRRRPVWGTCAGLILLAESANRTKQTGQELIGGLDVRVNRNHFGRQTESFEADLDLPFLATAVGGEAFDTDRTPFHSVFIRAPVVEKILPRKAGIQDEEEARDDTVVAPSRSPQDRAAEEASKGDVEVLARLPGRAKALKDQNITAKDVGEDGDIIAVRQGNVVGTSFHPELTGDARIHVWWLKQVLEAVRKRKDG
ncbi:hypothetical protein LTR28_008972 [Elasticomyces elasticus]|nr:hypothetical protein LTR28_008972 [Elasticomyces elasticus]